MLALLGAGCGHVLQLWKASTHAVSLAGMVQALVQLAVKEAQVDLQLNQKDQSRGCEQT